MYGKPFKMMGKSPMMKKLVGKQNNLPAELKAKIEASPAKKKKVTVEKVGNDTRKTITRTRRDGTIKKRKVILSTPVLAIFLPGSTLPGCSCRMFLFVPLSLALNLTTDPTSLAITPSLSFSIYNFRSRPAPIAIPASV